MIKSRHNLSYCLFTAVLIAGCSGTRNLPEGDLLYTGGSVDVVSESTPKKERKALEAALEPLLRPKPNASFLGMRPKLFFYNLAGEPTKDKGFRYWLRNKVGEPPVLYSEVDLEYNKKVLQNYAENNGYFNTTSVADSTRSGKKATAEYTLDPKRLYTIRDVKFPADSSLLGTAVSKVRRGSVLKKEAGYSLDNIKLERGRIDTRLKEKGFYYFNEDYLLVQVDSTVADHKVDLIVKIKNETPDLAKNQ